MDRHPLAHKVNHLLDVGWDGFLPVNVDALCRAMWVHVAEHESKSGGPLRLVVEGELALILVPDTLPEAKRRLYVAFLLALYLSGASRYDLVPEVFGAERLLADPVARAGFCAAAHMLVPRVALEHLLAGEGASLATLARRLQVGEPAVHHRLVETGLIGKVRPQWTLVDGGLRKGNPGRGDVKEVRPAPALAIELTAITRAIRGERLIAC